MTKAELIDSISHRTGIDKVETSMILEAFMKTVKETMSKGENVFLRGFGSFLITHRA